MQNQEVINSRNSVNRNRTKLVRMGSSRREYWTSRLRNRSI